MTKNQLLNKSTENFSVSNNILYSLIYQQAGSVDKALMELVMNEIDAKATSVHISILSNLKSIVVSGDGCGFESRKDIESLFSCFGFDHETEKEKSRERSFGRYGLGRGQIFAFGATEWETNNFKIMVDLKSKTSKEALTFEIYEYENLLHKGCKVTIDLYEPMNSLSVSQLTRDLRKKLKYVKAPLYLNGIQINKSYKDEKWDLENEMFSLKLANQSSSTGLNVYNKGVYVLTFPHEKLGISGVVTSTSQDFDVNMARNDIQQSKCKLWAEVKKAIAPLAEKRQKKSLTNEDCLYLSHKLISGEGNKEELLIAKIITTVDGRKISLKSLSNHSSGRITVADRIPSMDGEMIHRTKLAAVISPVYLEEIGCDSLEDFVSKLSSSICKSQRSHIKNWNFMSTIENFSVLDFKNISNSFDSSHEIIETKKMNKLDAVKFSSIAVINKHAAAICGEKPRKLKAGRSKTTSAWTDGVSYIALDLSLIKKSFSNGHNSLIVLFNTLIHEYCHDESSQVSHGHDEKFDNKFRMIIESTSYTPFSTLTLALESYFKGRKSLGMLPTLSELKKSGSEISEKIRNAAY